MRALYIGLNCMYSVISVIVDSLHANPKIDRWRSVKVKHSFVSYRIYHNFNICDCYFRFCGRVGAVTIFGCHGPHTAAKSEIAVKYIQIIIYYSIPVQTNVSLLQSFRDQNVGNRHIHADLYRLCGSLHGLDTFWARGLSWVNKETTIQQHAAIFPSLGSRRWRGTPYSRLCGKLK